MVTKARPSTPGTGQSLDSSLWPASLDETSRSRRLRRSKGRNKVVNRPLPNHIRQPEIAAAVIQQQALEYYSKIAKFVFDAVNLLEKKAVEVLSVRLRTSHTFDIAEVLGKEKVFKRIKAGIEKIG